MTNSDYANREWSRDRILCQIYFYYKKIKNRKVQRLIVKKHHISVWEVIILKKTKLGRDLVVYMALGDGYLNPNGYLSIRHSLTQKEYIEWKSKLLNSHGINTTGLYFHNNNNYGVYEMRTYTHEFIKVYRRVLYSPTKKIADRKILNKLTPLGIAIWYMDDGGLSKKRENGVIVANELMINTHLTKEENQIIIDYFQEVWNIRFRQAKNRGKYRLVCGTKEARRFVEIVKPYVNQVECMKYKIDVKPESQIKIKK